MRNKSYFIAIANLEKYDENEDILISTYLSTGETFSAHWEQ